MLQTLDIVNYVCKSVSYLGDIHTPGAEGTTLTVFFSAWTGNWAFGSNYHLLDTIGTSLGQQFSPTQPL